MMLLGLCPRLHHQKVQYEQKLHPYKQCDSILPHKQYDRTPTNNVTVSSPKRVAVKLAEAQNLECEGKTEH